MSAWIVSKGHIDVLTNAMAQYGVIGPAMMQRVGQDLWEENHRSVNARYGEDTPTPEYRVEAVEADLAPVHIISAAHCYDYQSCEHGGWEDSQSYAYVTVLLAKVVSLHPEAERLWREGRQGIDYQWGYESLSQAVLSGALG